jgi:hypothetical protein
LEGIPERNKYNVHTKFHENLSHSKVEMARGWAHRQHGDTSLPLSFWEAGLEKSYKQCKSDHDHNFTTQCLHVAYNPNFYTNLYERAPYAHVYRLFIGGN